MSDWFQRRSPIKDYLEHYQRLFLSDSMDKVLTTNYTTPYTTNITPSCTSVHTLLICNVTIIACGGRGIA